MSNLLQVKNLHTQFHTEDGVVPAVQGVSFSVKKGESLGIVGESGCGKSVTCLSIMRLIGHPGKVKADEISFQGRDLMALSEKEMRKVRGNDMAVIFQEPMTSLNPVLTIGFQIQEVLKLHQGMKKQESREKSIEMLSMVGIPRPEKVVDDFPHALSGGMRQRAMIAMALSCNPRLIFADEPTTALDVTIQAQILELVKELKEKLHTAYVFISHDLGVIAEMTERVIVMYCGYIVEEGDVLSFFNSPKHPYSLGLLGSKPKLSDKKKTLHPIPGSVPNPLDLPAGCPYHPRCSRVMDICREKLPVLTDLGAGCFVRCWLYQRPETGRAE